jgi:hypothetical protein
MFIFRELAGMLENARARISAELEPWVKELDPQMDPRERVGKTPQPMVRVTLLTGNNRGAHPSFYAAETPPDWYGAPSA